MRFALVGLGRWGQTFIRTIKQIPSCELVATHSRNLMSYEALPLELQIAPNVSGPDGLDTLLHMFDVDTVIIATHPNSHYLLARQALWFRKHVICEKPCMFSDDQFFSIQELINPSIFFTDYTNLYHRIINTIEERIAMSDIKPTLRLVNTGDGPIRPDYSDLWDYGSHIASVIYHLFPNSLFDLEHYGYNDDGNHTIRLTSFDVNVEAVFGNKSSERKHSFEVLCGPQGAFWQNDKSENPLQVMLERFALGQVKSNINLSRKIISLLTRCEKMNKKA